MWTYKITNKDAEKKQVTVEFINGTRTESVTITPQDRRGFEHWVNSELDSRNGLEELMAENNLDVVQERVTAPEPSQAEKDRQLWLERDALQDRVSIAIDKGYMTGTEPKVAQLNKWLKENFKPEYIGIE